MQRFSTGKMKLERIRLNAHRHKTPAAESALPLSLRATHPHSVLSSFLALWIFTIYCALPLSTYVYMVYTLLNSKHFFALLALSYSALPIVSCLLNINNIMCAEVSCCDILPARKLSQKWQDNGWLRDYKTCSFTVRDLAFCCFLLLSFAQITSIRLRWEVLPHLQQ